MTVVEVVNYPHWNTEMAGIQGAHVVQMVIHWNLERFCGPYGVKLWLCGCLVVCDMSWTGLSSLVAVFKVGLILTGVHKCGGKSRKGARCE